jgi:hypothetical protein
MKGFVLEDFESEPRLRDDLREPEPDVHGGSWTDLSAVPAGQAGRKPDGVDFAS